MIDNAKLGWKTRVTRALEELGVTVEVAGVGMLEVQHDDWCKELKRIGECNCVPNIGLILPTGGFVIDVDGHPTKAKVVS